MSNIIRHNQTKTGPIVDARNSILPDVYFERIQLEPSETREIAVEGFELVAVVQSGVCDIQVGGHSFKQVGNRASIWDGKADSVYLGTGEPIEISAGAGPVEMVVAGGACAETFAPFRITPEQVESVVVGSSETKSRREIFHILGQNANGKAGNLLVSELYCEEGCWSGYPPHKHDETRDGETNHGELYHYRFNPPTGFGAQFLYDGESKRAVMTFDGDTFLIPAGYHPTVTSPGHSAYVFTILVGRAQRGLVQYFDPEHDHLTDHIPGLGAMRDKFK